jgi:hypothetical protein
MEEWNIGVKKRMEGWNIGMLEYGVMKPKKILSPSILPILPLFHYSNIPYFG